MLKTTKISYNFIPGHSLYVVKGLVGVGAGGIGSWTLTLSYCWMMMLKMHDIVTGHNTSPDYHIYLFSGFALVLHFVLEFN